MNLTLESGHSVSEQKQFRGVGSGGISSLFDAWRRKRHGIS